MPLYAGCLILYGETLAIRPSSGADLGHQMIRRIAACVERRGGLRRSQEAVGFSRQFPPLFTTAFLFVSVFALVAGCIGEDYCRTQEDCKGLKHPDCKGRWMCGKARCQWLCEQKVTTTTVKKKTTIKASTTTLKKKTAKTGGTTTTLPKKGESCGGIAGIRCPEGFECEYDGSYPDAGGTCAKKEVECSGDADCGIGGCSGQICAPKDKAASIITTCEWRQEYGCYNLTACGCVSGKCAWKNNPRFDLCIGSRGKERPDLSCFGLTDEECKDKKREMAKVGIRLGMGL